MSTTLNFEALFVNNPDFRQIQTHLARFNPIKIMQASRSEIRNSSILAWLMDPNENHGLGDDFLRVFLAAALKGKAGCVSALDILSGDFSDVEVRTEQNPDVGQRTRIDILIDCPSLNCMFIIENKFGATQGEQQLIKYYESVKARLEREGRGSTKLQGIYLTLIGEDPSADARDNFVPFLHQGYAEQLAFLIDQKRDSLSTKIVDFIEYFIEVVMESSPSSLKAERDMQEIAKRLYREHRKVIDYIVENGSQTVLKEAFSQLVGGSLEENKRFTVGGVELKLMRSAKVWCSFIPLAWLELLETAKQSVEPPLDEWPGCENWRLPVPIGFWVELNETNTGFKIRMAMEVGPLSHFDQRVSLIEKIESEAKGHGKQIAFSKSAKEQGKKFSIFRTENVATKNQDNPDDLRKDLEVAISRLIPYVGVVTQALERWVNDIKQKGWS